MKLEIVFAFVLGCAFAGAVTLVVDQLSLPVVSVDTFTGKCVRIESPAGDLPCSEIPVRYIRQTTYRASDFYRDPPADDIAGVQL
jgi:hypothetical protein